MARKVGDISFLGGLFRRKDKTKGPEHTEPVAAEQPLVEVEETPITVPVNQATETPPESDTGASAPASHPAAILDVVLEEADGEETTLRRALEMVTGFDDDELAETDIRATIRGDVAKTVLIDPEEDPLREKRKGIVPDTGVESTTVPETIFIDPDEEEDAPDDLHLAATAQQAAAASPAVIPTEETSPGASPAARVMVGAPEPPLELATAAPEETKPRLDEPFPEQSANRVPDTLSVSPHAQALARFIVRCDTPMMMSVQGEPGSGRTTLMRMTSEALAEAPVEVLWFDAWEFDQFDVHGLLSVLLMTELSLLAGQPISASTKVSRGHNEALALLQSDIDTLTRTLAARASKQVTTVEMDDRSTAERASQPVRDLAHNLFANVRSGLAALVADFLQSTKKAKIAVFVDNLDLVHPQRALQFIEHVGGLLAVPGCVVVVGLDTESIGRTYEGRGLDASTALSVFEKVFRVTYNTPVARLSLDDYLDELLQRAGIPMDRQDLPGIRGMVRHSVGANPRAIRALIDRLALLMCVHGALEPDARPEGERVPKARLANVLVGLACLARGFPDFWRLVAFEFGQDDENESNNRGLVALLQRPPKSEEGLEYALRMAMGAGLPVAGDSGTDAIFFTRLTRFIEAFRFALRFDQSGDPTDESVSDLYRAIRVMAMAGGTGGLMVDDPMRDEISEYCRRIMAALRKLVEIRPQIHNKWPHAVTEGKRYQYSMWFRPESFKAAWGPDRLFYRLTFSLEDETYVLLSLHCHPERVAERHVLRARIDGLRHIDELRDANFAHVDPDPNGWVRVEKKFGEGIDETPTDEATAIAAELKKLIEATGNYFDIDLSEQTITIPDKLDRPKQEIPTPCPKCGKKELEIVSRGSDGIIRLRCRACNHPLRTRQPATAGKTA